MEYEEIHFGLVWAVVSFTDTPDVSSLQKRLGGTVKIGEVLAQDTDVNRLVSLEQLFSHVPNDPRMEFGISGYPEEKGFGIRLKKIALARKKELTTQGFHARVVTSSTPALSSAAVKKNKLMTHGAEFMVFAEKGVYTLAVTRTVQDFEGFAERDHSRKDLDAKSGMLPPQLARILVNLAEVQPGGTILDPFCGSGTVLMEARDLGFHVIGSDNSAKAIRNSERNLAAQESATHWRLIQSDAAFLPKNLLERNIPAIVTEPFLGPPQHRAVPSTAQKTFFEKTRTMYNNAFKAFSEVLADGGRIVFIFPALTSRDGPVLYSFLDDILLRYGFRIVQPVSKEGVMAYRDLLTKRNSLIYARRGQHVAREILLLEKEWGRTP